MCPCLHQVFQVPDFVYLRRFSLAIGTLADTGSPTTRFFLTAYLYELDPVTLDFVGPPIAQVDSLAIPDSARIPSNFVEVWANFYQAVPLVPHT
jgi:hypothetical protein